ncbi:amino acid ABC transporter ATP-binding protein [Nocardia sp. alder85J]|nr:amino acid ABC transporter ATP-binding protein [Nocardia sp. alder85J]
MLRLERVGKTFGDTTVLRDIDLEIRRGEIVVVIGPSGSGKSTLLRLIAQLETIDRGAIRLDDELLGAEWRRGKLIRRTQRGIGRQRRRIGMVFQQFHLFGHLTALGNVTHAPRKVAGLRRDAAADLGRALLRRVGLEAHADAYPAQLSGGQQQRVAIARALAMRPDLLLCDEPTSALDPELVGEVLQVLRDLAAGGQTMLVVTHEMSFARRVASRILFLDNGVVVGDDAPEALFASDNPRIRRFLDTQDGHDAA